MTALFVVRTPAYAQTAARGYLSLLAGPASYDLAGTGTAFEGTLGLTWQPAGRVLLLEPSVGYFRYTPFTNQRVTYLFPEVSTQLQIAHGPVRPYLGAGAGAAIARSGGVGNTDFTVHGVIGVRADLSAGWGVRGEARLRAVDPWASNVLAFGVGVSRRVF